MKTKNKIIRARKMGFCFGVEEAVSLCERVLADEEAKNHKKYILGMLVHNKFVVETFQEKGFTILEEENLDLLKKGDVVVIRAHGIAKAVKAALDAKEVKIYDATCVFVTQIRKKILWAIEQGYDIIFIGDKNHPEVIGITSYAEKIQIFSDLEELKQTRFSLDKKYFLSTQTTLNQKKFLEIKEYIEKHYSNIAVFNKICGATQERQKATEDLAKQVEIIFVLGGKKSSNTKKLYEIAKNVNPNAYLLEDENDLDTKCLEGKSIVGLTAGASTPEEIIKNIENKIRGILDA